MANLMRLVFTLIVLIILAACSPDAPSDSELARVFSSHERQFSNAEQLCFARKEIRSIRIKNGKYQVETDSGNGALSQSEINQVAGLFRDTGLLQMNCLWLYSQGQGELSSSKFWFYATGLGVSGRSKSIDHVFPVAQAWENESMRRGELRSLPKEHWFIYEPQD
jgi:hypothetical protein